MSESNAPRSRRVFLAAAAGAAAATAVSAIDPRSAVRAGVDGDVVLGALNTATTTTSLRITANNLDVFRVRGISENATIVGANDDVGCRRARRAFGRRRGGGRRRRSRRQRGRHRRRGIVDDGQRSSSARVRKGAGSSARSPSRATGSTVTAKPRPGSASGRALRRAWRWSSMARRRSVAAAEWRSPPVPPTSTSTSGRSAALAAHRCVSRTSRSVGPASMSRQSARTSRAPAS